MTNSPVHLRDLHEQVRGMLLKSLYAQASRVRRLDNRDVYALAFERYGCRSMLALTIQDFNDLYMYCLTQEARRRTDQSLTQTGGAQA